MPTSQGKLKPFVMMNRSVEVSNTVGYPVGGNITSSATAVFVATWSAIGVNVINVRYMRSGQIVPGMGISGVGIASGTVIVGPLSQNGTGRGGVGSYTISNVTTVAPNAPSMPSVPADAVTALSPTTKASTITGASLSSTPNGPGGIIGPIPGYNCVNIMDLRDYYNLPYPPATPLASPPVIAIVSFGGGIYGQPVTTGQYAGFWKCTDISGNNGAPIQILVAPINGAINAPNADDGGATLENTVDVATVNAFYGMVDPRPNAPIYTAPVIILYIAPSSDTSEMYRTFYTVLKNPVVCNGKSYSPTIVSCSWGAPEIAWTQKMAFPPNPSIPVDNTVNPSGIAELNEINDLFAEATKNGINICAASGDIPLTSVSSSVNTFNYAQQLLVQGLGGPGFDSTQTPDPQVSVFPITQAERDSLPPPQVMFPASSPYVTCVGGSAVYFPSLGMDSLANPAEFAWARSNGGISTAFSIPAYQQQDQGAAAASAAQFLSAASNTARLTEAALGTPSPVLAPPLVTESPLSGGYTAPNTGITLSVQSKNAIYDSTLAAFNSAQSALSVAHQSGADDSLMSSLIQTVKEASTALTTAETNKKLALDALSAAEDLVVKSDSISNILYTAGSVFGAAAAAPEAASQTQTNSLNAVFAAQKAAYTNLITPNLTTATTLQAANLFAASAQAAAANSAVAAVTLPAAITNAISVADQSVAQAASAVVAPSLATHPTLADYTTSNPITSPLVPLSNAAYTSAQTVAGDIPYDPSATSAPSYLLTTLGLGYNTVYVDPSGVPVSNVRDDLNAAVTKANDLVLGLNNQPGFLRTDTNNYSQVSRNANTLIVNAGGQVGPYDSDSYKSALIWCRKGPSYTMPRSGTWSNSTPNGIPTYNSTTGISDFTPGQGFAQQAMVISGNGAAFLSSYQSGLSVQPMAGFDLFTGLASAAGAASAAIYPVTQDEILADVAAGYPYGQQDINGVSGSRYGGITAGLVNLRNIYANTTLASRRVRTANKAAHEAKDAFVAWADANETLATLQSEATALYNQVPGPTSDRVLAMDAKVVSAKAVLTNASYVLAKADKYAVLTARLAKQSTGAASLYMGNHITGNFSTNSVDYQSTSEIHDALGNLRPLPTSAVASGNYQGTNNSNCPAIQKFSTASQSAKDSLKAAQALIAAAANDTYLSSTLVTSKYHTVTGVDSSGIVTVNLTGTSMLVQDAQFAAAGASAQVANVAFADATDSMARFADWHNVALVAQAINSAKTSVYSALTDSSGNTTDASGNSSLSRAAASVANALRLIVSATTPFNQQATPSATLATNSVVVLSAKLESMKNVCQAAETAINLAASTYGSTTGGTVSNGGVPAGSNVGSSFTVNMAYAKVSIDAAQAACTAAAIYAREEAVVSARRANMSAIALEMLVGKAFINKAVAGFLDASGNLVSETGYGPSNFLPGSYGRVSTTNGLKPPAVTANTVLYQGSGGLNFSSDYLGRLDVSSNPQPNIITNLTYTSSTSSSVYDAVKDLKAKAQLVIDALEVDASGNSAQMAVTDASGNSPIPSLTYPNVNSANALNVNLGTTAGAGWVAVKNCLLSAYEAQQWVVASANSSFVTFGPNNTNLVSFTPSLIGVATKLAADADAVLETMINAEGAILYSLSKRPTRVALHDVDAANFAAAFNANQASTDTLEELQNLAIDHEQNTIIAFHLGDLANALSPIVANAATAASQAAALGAMAWSAPVANPNVNAVNALSNANFPPNGWGNSSMATNTVSPGNVSGQFNNSTNPNVGPYNGTLTGSAPFPAGYSSTSSRLQSPSASVFSVSAQLLAKRFSDIALDTAKAVSVSTESISAFNQKMIDVSTITPSLVDTAVSASQNTLAAARASNYATSLNNQGVLGTDLTSFTSALLSKTLDAILAAAKSANSNLDNTDPNNASYLARKNMVNLWNIAIDAGREALRSSEEQYGTLGVLSDMGKADDNYTTNGNTAKYVASPNPTDLGALNNAVRNAYNATTGAPKPDEPNLGNYTYISFPWVNSSGTTVTLTNVPENQNDTQEAYKNAVAALNAVKAVGGGKLASILAAQSAIHAALDAAIDADANAGTLTDGSGSLWTASNSPVSGMEQKTSLAVGFWANAVEFADSLANGTLTHNADNLAKLMAIVGINFSTVLPGDTSSEAISLSNNANALQAEIMSYWALGTDTSGAPNATTAPFFNTTLGYLTWPGYIIDTSANNVQVNLNLARASAFGTYTDTNGTTLSYNSLTAASGSKRWSAYYYTQAIMGTGTVAYETARVAWNAVLNAYNVVVKGNTSDTLDLNARSSNISKSAAIYSVKLALQSAARATEAAATSAKAAAALAAATDSYDDVSASVTTDNASASTAALNMYRCVPDIAMHANSDDLPVIFRLNGGTVYVGGTSVSAAMFAGFLGVVQSHAPVNFFVNPVLYDNYTYPSPLFNDISGSSQIWYAGSAAGPTVPPRIANILPGVQKPLSGLGSGIYNCNVGLGSIKAMNLSALMEVPHLVKSVHPDSGDNKTVTVYPGTTATVTAYVEPIDAYNPHVVWSCSSPNATVSQTNGPVLSNNGQNDTNPYTPYDPLLSGVQTPSIGNYSLGSVGTIAKGTNPFNANAPCLIFTATVTGVTAVPASAPLPVITVTSTDGSSVYGKYDVSVLPAIQVTGVSISALNEYENPSNTTLFLGTTLQLVANVTPVTATNQRVYWWSSNTSVVNVDASGLLTSLAPGQVTVKATSLNNNISASISVYVPTPITGLSVLPTTITLNPNMLVHPLKNMGLIRAIVQPAEADYKHLTWEIVSSTQAEPAPAGISDVVSLPINGTVLARDSSGDITDNTEATVTALSNGTAVLKVSTYGEPYGVYGTYTSMVTVNVVTPLTDVVMTQTDMVINLNPHTAEYDSSRSLPESYKVTATLKPAYPSNMNVFWSSSNPKVAVVSNNSPAVLNTTSSDPNFGLWQITETITPLSNGTTVIKVTTADGQKTDVTTVVVTTPVTGLSMSALPITLNPTKLYTLQATVLPTTATNRALIWESTNTAIATVDSNGVVKAVTSGSCGISATTVDGDFMATATVNVVTPLVGVQLLVNTPLPIHINDVVQILVVMVPTTASNQQFTWTVTDGIDGNIFTTGPPQNGNIVYLDAVQAGNSVFTVTTADGNKQAAINLQVVQW